MVYQSCTRRTAEFHRLWSSTRKCRWQTNGQSSVRLGRSAFVDFLTGVTLHTDIGSYVAFIIHLLTRSTLVDRGSHLRVSLRDADAQMGENLERSRTYFQKS